MLEKFYLDIVEKDIASRKKAYKEAADPNVPEQGQFGGIQDLKTVQDAQNTVPPIPNQPVNLTEDKNLKEVCDTSLGLMMSEVIFNKISSVILANKNFEKLKLNDAVKNVVSQINKDPWGIVEAYSAQNRPLDINNWIDYFTTPKKVTIQSIQTDKNLASEIIKSILIDRVTGSSDIVDAYNSSTDKEKFMADLLSAVNTNIENSKTGEAAKINIQLTNKGNLKTILKESTDLYKLKEPQMQIVAASFIDMFPRTKGFVNIENIKKDLNDEEAATTTLSDAFKLLNQYQLTTGITNIVKSALATNAAKIDTNLAKAYKDMFNMDIPAFESFDASLELLGTVNQYIEDSHLYYTEDRIASIFEADKIATPTKIAPAADAADAVTQKPGIIDTVKNKAKEVVDNTKGNIKNAPGRAATGLMAATSQTLNNQFVAVRQVIGIITVMAIVSALYGIQINFEKNKGMLGEEFYDEGIVGAVLKNISSKFSRFFSAFTGIPLKMSAFVNNKSFETKVKTIVTQASTNSDLNSVLQTLGFTDVLNTISGDIFKDEFFKKNIDKIKSIVNGKTVVPFVTEKISKYVPDATGLKSWLKAIYVPSKSAQRAQKIKDTWGAIKEKSTFGKAGQ